MHDPLLKLIRRSVERPKPVGACRNPRQEADAAHAEVTRLQVVLEEYLRKQEDAVLWLRDNLRLARKGKP